MKYIITCFFIFISSIVFAQINTDLVYGSWVKCKVTFEDGSELPDDSPLKYNFVKYIFSKPDKFNISLIYYINGKTQSFEIVQNKLIIKSNSGVTLNSFLIA